MKIESCNPEDVNHLCEECCDHYRAQGEVWCEGCGIDMRDA